MQLLLVLVVLASYLVGAIPFGYLVARARGVDILRQGSGNIGATNVGRLLGRRWGLLVFALDLGKGACPAAAARALTAWTAGLPPDTLPALAAVAAFLGHLFPIYLRFHGGKGVATGLGAVLVLMPVPALAGLAAWLAAVSSSRYVSLASLTAAAVLCVARLVLTPEPFAPDHLVVTLFCLVAAGLVAFRHRGNVRRLWQGNENSLKESPTMLLFSKVVHVLALGLWFGMAVFFLVVGAVLFPYFMEQAARPAPLRPQWLPEWQVRSADAPAEKQLSEPIRKEQGVRVAGAAVGQLFPWYFGISAACAVLTALTALGWCLRCRCWLHLLRAVVLLLALVTVAVGWTLEQKVKDLRGPRDETAQRAASTPEPSAEVVRAAEAAKAEFDRWHGYSMSLNGTTLLLVMVGMVLAAWLPTAPVLSEPTGEKEIHAPAVVAG